jgi:hypothetical protein
MKTEEFRTLDINIHHGRYVPADNVVKISTEKLEYTTPCDKDRRLYIYHICDAIVRAIDSGVGEFDSIKMSINKSRIKAVGFDEETPMFGGRSNDKKVFCIEIKEAPIS